jgi:hypothetical protein
MTYEVLLLPQAEQDLLALPLPLQTFLEQQLNQLAASPASLSRPAVFPYPSGYQLFQPDAVLLDDRSHQFTILFRYGQDETTLYIAGIGHMVTD